MAVGVPPAVFGRAGCVQGQVQDDLNYVVGYLIIEVLAERPAEPVLVFFITQRGDMADDIEDEWWTDVLLGVSQRYEDGRAVRRVCLAV